MQQTVIRLNSQRATASSHRLAAAAAWPQSPQKARFSPSSTFRQHDDTTLAAGALYLWCQVLWRYPVL